MIIILLLLSLEIKIIFIYVDKNGNKCLKVESTDFNEGRGFSIQTNVNLPLTHNKYSKETDFKKLDEFEIIMLECEVWDYVKLYGTNSQRLKVLGHTRK